MKGNGWYKKEWPKLNTRRQSRNDTAAFAKNSSPLRSDGRFRWYRGLLCVIGCLCSITWGSHITWYISWLGITVAIRHCLLDNGLQMFSLWFMAVDNRWDVTGWTRRGSHKRTFISARDWNRSQAIISFSILQCWDSKGLQQTTTHTNKLTHTLDKTENWNQMNAEE